MSKRALGKGLDALISQGTISQETEPQTGVRELGIEDVESNADQPRKNFDAQALNELAQSIKEKGIIQPIIVEARDGKYQIVAGERRFRAAKIAGLSTVPAIVRVYNETEKLQIALVENLQRENLNPIEEAEAFNTLIDQMGLRQEDVAKQVGKSRSAIANSLRLLKLPQKIKKTLIEGSLSPGHGRALLAVANPADRDLLFDTIVSEAISVREAEIAADKLNKGGRGSKSSAKSSPKEKKSDPEIQDVEQKLIEALGTKVKLKGTLSKGRIEISYFTKDDLDRLFDLLSNS